MADRLPITVICELLGVPATDTGLFRTAASVVGGHIADDEAALRVVAALDAFDAYVRELIDARRGAPRADLISDLVTAGTEGERLTEDELVSMVGIVLFGGYEPSAQLIGNTLVALLRHPDQLAAVRADFGLIPAVIEETMRYDGPVTPIDGRSYRGESRQARRSGWPWGDHWLAAERNGDNAPAIVPSNGDRNVRHEPPQGAIKTLRPGHSI